MKKVIVKNNKNNIVKKDQDLIFAKHDLPEQSLKIMACLISQIKKDDSDFEKYILTTKDYKELTKTKHKDVLSEMIIASNKLLKTIIKVDTGAHYLHTTFIKNFKYEKEDGSLIIYKIDEDFRPYLLNLKKNFLSYNIFNVLDLKGSYSIKLYELLKHNFNTNIKYTTKPFTSLTMELKEFKEMFNIPKSYTIVNIKKNILDYSKKQFKEKTDIKFTYVLNKKYGRKYDEITFKILPTKAQ